jgi:hypothetical protein
MGFLSRFFDQPRPQPAAPPTSPQAAPPAGLGITFKQEIEQTEAARSAPPEVRPGELVSRILVCGRVASADDAFIRAERALMDRIVAGHSNLVEECVMTTMRGRELPERGNRAAVQSFTWNLQERMNLRGLNFTTEFHEQDGFSFLVICFLERT